MAERLLSIGETLSFFRSVIRGGESWSPTCDSAISAAFEQLARYADIEALAALEHESWSDWTKWMLNEMESELGDRELLRNLECVKRWRRQMTTPYSDLSDQEKESDRNEVRRKRPMYLGLQRKKDD